MCKCGVLLSSVVIVSTFILVTSFNLDTFNYCQHKGPDRSMFGFSIATHKEHGKSWVIVGAPKAQGRQSRVQQGGVVYKCNTASDDDHDEIIFSDERSVGGRVEDDKNHQWFGATVQSAGPDMPIVACAPRYVWFTRSREERRDPVGTCYVVRNNFRNSSEYSPCRTSLFGYHRQGSCQAGFSAGISKDGKRLFVGAPGSWYWQGQVIQQSLDNRPAVMSTPEGPADEDDSYRGYAMAVGDFNDEGVQGVAVGMPKGDVLVGKVLLYTWSLTNFLNVTGEQCGSYFGYALAASDVDGDRKDDLIVSAPMHTEPNSENKYEVGRVYVVYQGYDGKFMERTHLDGINSKSRFGLSLCSLGDMNLDGFGDFAVGAPYDGPNEGGAVYIFQGSADGVIKRYSQVITAENMKSGGGYPVNTFGFSLSGGLDLDGNDYPDMAIGAYSSDKAFFFRARPVVKVVQAYVTITTNETNNQIYLDRRHCTKPGDRYANVACADVKVCMKYSGIGTPPRVVMNLEYTLDARKSKYTRMYLEKNSGNPVISGNLGNSTRKTMNRTLLLYKDAPLNCELRDRIYIEDQIIDKLTDLEIEVKYSLQESYQQFPRDPRSILTPIVDLSTPAVINDSVSIFKDCGNDNLCIPDLRLVVEKKVESYKYEIGKSIEFLVQVTNHADDAYNTKFYIHLPNGIGFKVARRNDKALENLQCSAAFNGSIFVCDIGNPLGRDTVMSFTLEVEPLRQQQKLLNPTYFFYMNVTSRNPENDEDLHDNRVEIHMNVLVNAVIATEGKSHPPSVYYETYNYTEAAKTWDTEIGPLVIHEYTVTNTGPADVEQIEIFLVWPKSTLKGEDLLYLLEQPHTSGGVVCEQVDANYKDYTLADSSTMNIWQALNRPLPGPTDVVPPILPGPIPTVPGEVGDTKTMTETTVQFFDIRGENLAETVIKGTPPFEEYWIQISGVAKDLPKPITVQSSSVTVIERYIYGKLVDTKKVPSRPPPSLPYTSYQIRSNINTTVSYFDAPGNLVLTEVLHEEPGSAMFRRRTDSTKRLYPQIQKVFLNTTTHITYTPFDGKVPYYEEFSYRAGPEDGNGETSSTITILTITFSSPDGKTLVNDTMTTEPGSEIYWERISKVINQYRIPFTIHTTGKKIVTVYIHGVENKEEVGITTGNFDNFAAHIDIKTKITVSTPDGRVLTEKIIADEPSTLSYNNYINDIVKGYNQIVIVSSNTTKTIRYRTNDGKVLYTTYINEHRIETLNPHQLPTASIITITKLIFLDHAGNKIGEKFITAEPGTTLYWKEITTAISEFHVPIHNFQVTATEYIVYYIDGHEIRRNETGKRIPDNQFTTQIDTVTKLVCTSSDGTILHEGTIHEAIGEAAYNSFVTSLVDKYRQPIIISANMTRTITCRGSDGKIVYTGYINVHKTEHHPQQPKTSQIVYSTTVVFLDSNGNIIDRRTITAEPDTKPYWEEITTTAGQFHVAVTSIRVTIKKYRVYYVNNVETRREEIREPSLDIQFTIQTDTVTILTCQSTDGTTLRQTTIYEEIEGVGYNNFVQEVANTFRQPVEISANMTKTITCRRSDGSVAYTRRIQQTKVEYKDLGVGGGGGGEWDQRRVSTITVVRFYDYNRNLLREEKIVDEPNTPIYWEHINKFIVTFQIPVTIETNTTTVTTYIRGHERRTEQAPIMFEPQITIHIDVTTTVTFYGSNGNVLHTETISGEPGTMSYEERIAAIIERLRESFTLYIDIVKTITYRRSDGTVIHTGTVTERKTEDRRPAGSQRKTAVTKTVITFYDRARNLVHNETVRDEPGSEAYWKVMKVAFSRFPIPLTIHTTTSTVITYFTNGEQTGTEEVHGNSGLYQQLVAEVDVTNVITYYDSNNRVLKRETVHGGLSLDELYQHTARFVREYSSSFRTEIETNIQISYRTTDGRVIYKDVISEHKPGTTINPSNVASETTITVYGPDKRTILFQEKIHEEPGSDAYNRRIADIISRFRDYSYFNTTTKHTIKYYTADGRSLNEQTLNDLKTSFIRGGNSAGDLTSTIVIYGPDGQPIHRDTVPGTITAEQIAQRYGGFIKSYAGQLNEDGSIGSSVTVVDTPYPGNRPHTFGKHFNEFDGGYNRSSQYSWSNQDNYNYGSGQHQSHNLQDLNQQNLGSYAHGKGFVVGGLDLGGGGGRNVDHYVDGQARSNFDRYSRSQGYDVGSNHVAHNEEFTKSKQQKHHRRHKRDVDETEVGIQKLTNCTTSECMLIKCVTGPMRKGHEVHIALRSRVNILTVKNISTTQPVNIQSRLLARISQFQDISGPPANRTLYRQEAVTAIMAPKPDYKPDIVPLWVVVVSAVAGTLILLLLVFLMHKAGFFRRNRPSDAPERQPLNRNGHFQHGDEAL